MEGVGPGRAQAPESPGLGVAPYQAPLTDYPVLLEKLQEKWEEAAEKQKEERRRRKQGTEYWAQLDWGQEFWAASFPLDQGTLYPPVSYTCVGGQTWRQPPKTPGRRPQVHFINWEMDTHMPSFPHSPFPFPQPLPPPTPPKVVLLVLGNMSW